MTGRTPSNKRSLIHRVLGRGQKIEGLRESEVRSDERISVEADAMIYGDVVAPLVTVQGMVRGRIVTHELIIEPDGQVLGDVWTDALEQKSGGALCGWISALTPALAAVLQTGGVLPWNLGQDDGEKASMQTLRGELADAVLARKTLERELKGRVGLATVDSEKHAVQVGQELEDTLGVVRQLQGELEALRVQEQQGSQSLQKALQHESDLQEELAATIAGRDEFQVLNTHLQNAVKDVENLLTDREERVNRLAEELDQTKELAAKRLHELGDLNEFHADAQQRVEALTGQLMTATDGIRERDRVLDDLGNNLVESQELVEQQHYDLNAARDQLEKLGNQVAEMQDGYREAQTARQNAEGVLQQQEREILRLKAELDVAQAEAEQDRADLTRIQREFEEQAAVIASLQARLADEAGAQRELERMQEQLAQARRLAEAQRTLAESRAAAAAELQTDMERHQRQKRAMEADLSSGRGQASKLEKKLTTAHEQISFLQVDLKSAEDHVEALKGASDRKLEQSRLILQAARERVATMQAQLEQTQADFEDVSQQVAVWRKESERRDETLKEALMERNKQQAELVSELSMSRSIVVELNQDIDKFQTQLEGRDQKVAQLYAEMGELQAKVNEMKGQSETWADQVRDLQAGLAASQDELGRKEEQLADLMAWVERSRTMKGLQPPTDQ